MVHHALEFVETFPVWEMEFGGGASCEEEIGASCGPAVLAFDYPFPGLLIKLSINDSSVKRRIFLDAQSLVNMLEALR